MDKLSLTLKYLAGAFLLLILSFFTYAGKVPADVLEVAVFAGLAAIGVHAVGKSNAESSGATVTNSVTVNKEGGYAHLNLLAALAGAACVLLLAACATTGSTTSTSTATGTTTTVATPDLTQLCSTTQTVLTSISAAFTVYDANTSQTLKDASSVVATLCTAGTTVDAAYLAKMANTTIPALVTLTKGAGLDAATKAEILAGLAVAQIAVSAVNSSLLAGTSATPAVKALFLKK